MYLSVFFNSTNDRSFANFLKVKWTLFYFIYISLHIKKRKEINNKFKKILKTNMLYISSTNYEQRRVEIEMTIPWKMIRDATSRTIDSSRLCISLTMNNHIYQMKIALEQKRISNSFKENVYIKLLSLTDPWHILIRIKYLTKIFCCANNFIYYY